jgi:hypothetical protein
VKRLRPDCRYGAPPISTAVSARRELAREHMALAQSLKPLSPVRRRAVLLWLLTPVSICRICELPVYPTQPRCADVAAGAEAEMPDALHSKCACSLLDGEVDVGNPAD